MRWTRRHPHLAWFALASTLAFVALFLRDVGAAGGATAPVIPFVLVLAFALVLAIATLLVVRRRRDTRRARHELRRGDRQS